MINIQLENFKVSRKHCTTSVNHKRPHNRTGIGMERTQRPLLLVVTSNVWMTLPVVTNHRELTATKLVAKRVVGNNFTVFVEYHVGLAAGITLWLTIRSIFQLVWSVQYFGSTSPPNTVSVVNERITITSTVAHVTPCTTVSTPFGIPFPYLLAAITNKILHLSGKIRRYIDINCLFKFTT